MKKTIILGLAGLTLLLGSGELSASEAGVKFGANFAAVRNAGADTGSGFPVDYSGRTGLSMGFFYSFSLLDWLSLQCELLYVQNGFQRQLAHGEGLLLQQRIRLNYLELPLLVRIEPSRSFYAMAGIYWGFRLSARMQVQIPDQDLFSQVLDEARDVDRGWTAAFGLALDDDSGAFIELRYKRGSRGIFDIPGVAAQASEGFTLSLGYGF